MRVSIAWLGAVVTWAEREGASRRRLLDAAGLTEPELEDPATSPTDVQEVALWRAVVEALDEPAAGLRFGASIHTARAFGVVGYLARVAQTYRESLDDIVRFHRLLGLAATRVSAEGALTTVSFELSPALLELRQSGDAWAAAAVSALRATTFKRTCPLEVRLMSAPPARPAEYQRFFGCPLRFGRAGFALDWATDVLLEPIPTRDAMSHKQFERTAQRAGEARSR